MTTLVQAPLDRQTLEKIDAWWRAANYLSIGQIYLYENPLLRTPLRPEHGNLHVRGYKEEGTTTTPFDMTVLNDLDRFHLVMDVIDRLPQLGARAAYIKQALGERLIEHTLYVTEHGEDMPEIREWSWPG
jgi:phosphoketolase